MTVLFAAARLAAGLLTAARSAAGWRTAEPPMAGRLAPGQAAVPVKRPWQHVSLLARIRLAGSPGVWPVRSVVLAVTTSALSAGLASWLLAGVFQAAPPFAARPNNPAGTGAHPGKGAARHGVASGTGGTGRTITVDGSALVGRPVGVVRERLRALGLQIRVQWRPQGHPRPGTVVALHPSGALPADSVVVLTAAASPAAIAAYAAPVPPDRQGGSSGYLHGHGNNQKHWH